jgi:hypothetical protein
MLGVPLDFRWSMIHFVAAPPQPHDYYQYFNDFSTPFIAFVALIVTGYFAWRQWQTAHEQRNIEQQRVVMDLFERRMEIFDALNFVITNVIAHNRTTDMDIADFVKAQCRVDFLFGPEVKEYISVLFNYLKEHKDCCLLIENATEDKKDKLGEKRMKLCEFYTKFPELLAPYVRIHAKLP